MISAIIMIDWWSLLAPVQGSLRIMIIIMIIDHDDHNDCNDPVDHDDHWW